MRQLYNVPSYADRANQMYATSAATYKGLTKETKTEKEKDIIGDVVLPTAALGYGVWRQAGSPNLLGGGEEASTAARSLLNAPPSGPQTSETAMSMAQPFPPAGQGMSVGAPSSAAGPGMTMAEPIIPATQGMSMAGLAEGASIGAPAVVPTAPSAMAGLATGMETGTALAAGAGEAMSIGAPALAAETIGAGAVAEGAAAGSLGGPLGMAVGALVGLSAYFLGSR